MHGRLGRFSRTALQRLIKEGNVHVDGRAVKPSYEIHGGEIIEAVVPPAEPADIQGENIPLDIIWEDEHLIALNKQAGIVVHPARGIGSGTLVNGLVYYAESLSTGSQRFRPGIVHRLDKDTTGVMLVAKNDQVHWRMAQQFEQRKVRKTYIAVAEREMELLQPLLSEAGVEPVGRVVLGTVKGDLHDIGKNLVRMMLQGGGFEVIDCGIDVSAEKFIEAIKESGAKVLAMSALLTTTMPQMAEVVKAVKEAGMDEIKTMIGGAPVTQAYADEIGADGYAADAASAVDTAKELSG